VINVPGGGMEQKLTVKQIEELLTGEDSALVVSVSGENVVLDDCGFVFPQGYAASLIWFQHY
jgi:hypothetical protein